MSIDDELKIFEIIKRMCRVWGIIMFFTVGVFRLLYPCWYTGHSKWKILEGTFVRRKRDIILSANSSTKYNEWWQCQLDKILGLTMCLILNRAEQITLILKLKKHIPKQNLKFTPKIYYFTWCQVLMCVCMCVLLWFMSCLVSAAI